MARYLCSACGAESGRWAGQCGTCKEWNTVAEAPAAIMGNKKKPFRPTNPNATLTRLDTVDASDRERVATGIGEFDRVAGGGLVTGSLVLLAGEPGAGKSTLLAQVTDALVGGGHRTLYFSGEESAGQIRLRAERLGLRLGSLEVMSTTSVGDVAEALVAHRPPFAVIDSIQTLSSDSSDAAAGGPGQIREVTGHLLRIAKSTGTTLLIVGHVTKEAAVAGPKTLEHLVDAVLLLEGERSGTLRLLRAVKNRFGAVDEVGLFEMTETGMKGVDAPTPLHTAGGVAFGRAIALAMEGTRPLAVEVQALVAKAAYSSGRRVTNGVPEKRVAMLLAVLERYAGIDLSAHDVYVATGAGITISETGADAAVCAAIASSYWSTPIAPDVAFVGEVTLGGGLRSPKALVSRLKEAARLGITTTFGPDITPTRGDYRNCVDLADLLGCAGVLSPKGAAAVPGKAAPSGPPWFERKRTASLENDEDAA